MKRWCSATVLGLAALVIGASSVRAQFGVSECTGMYKYVSFFGTNSNAAPQGNATLCLLQDFRVLSYVIWYTGLSSPRLSVELHAGRSLPSGPLLLTFAGPGATTDTLSGEIAAPDTVSQLLRAGPYGSPDWYLLITSTAFPAGELRGMFGFDDAVRATTWGGLRETYRK